MDFPQWREEQRRQREFSHRVGADAQMGVGAAFRVELCDNVMHGRVVGVTRRWRYGDVPLAAQEALALDPRNFPPGTLIMIAPPGWAPPIQVWYTYEEVAFMLRRAKPTIRNLVYKHKLEHKTYWDSRGEHRRRVTDLPPATVRRLAELTGRGHWVVPVVDRPAPRLRRSRGLEAANGSAPPVAVDGTASPAQPS